MFRIEWITEKQDISFKVHYEKEAIIVLNFSINTLGKCANKLLGKHQEKAFGNDQIAFERQLWRACTTFTSWEK